MSNIEYQPATRPDTSGDIPTIRLDRDQYSTLQTMKQDDALMRYWTRKGCVRANAASVLPDLWVTAVGSDGTDIEGLLLACDTDGPRENRTSYDLSGRYALLVPFVGLGYVSGWMASDVALHRIDNTALAPG